MKQNEFNAKLIAAGCSIIRHGSRHDIWYSPITGKMWPLPRHQSKEIPIGTLNKAKKELGID